MRQKIFFIILLSFLIFPMNARHLKSDFKVVGYYSLRSAMNDFNKFPFKRLTHVNLFFLNPDSLGNFTREKMVLGVPFYGYGFGPEITSSVSGSKSLLKAIHKTASKKSSF